MTLLATTTAMNVVLAILAFNVFWAAVLWVVEDRERLAHPSKLYVPCEWADPDWDFPVREDDDLPTVLGLDNLERGW